MNPTKVIISVNTHSAAIDDPEKEYAFTNHRTCVVGRAANCDIQVPTDTGHRDVSRHHCLLEIDPPSVRIRDLGSTNGTFVNGERLEREGSKCHPEDTDQDGNVGRELEDGDVVQVGAAVLSVRVESPWEAMEPVYLPPLM